MAVTSSPTTGRGGVPGESPESRQPLRQTARRALLPLLLAAAVIAVLFAVEPVTISSDSMLPTLESGQRVLLDKLTYRFRDPRPDELIAFHAPQTGDLTLKRVVAVAGDELAIKDGVLRVNGTARDEPFVDASSVDSVYFGPVTVPAGTVFVLGDNRANSIDSRTFGAVPVSDVVGRVVWRF